MTEKKKTVVSLTNKSESTKKPTLDADAFFNDPEALKRHMDVITTFESDHSKTKPVKPAIRVVSLDSVSAITNRPESGLKITDKDESDQQNNVRSFSKNDRTKPRKK